MRDSHFYLHHDPKQEVLAEVLLDKLRGEGAGDPFYQSHVLVRNQGMATWLRQRLARATGLAMQIEFPQPAKFRQGVLEGDSVGLEELKWRIYRELPDLAKHPSASAVDEYLGWDHTNADSALKRYQLSGHLASLFDKYLLYRPDWIAAWDSGKSAASGQHEKWQRELWTRLGKQGSVQHWTQELLASGQIEASNDLPGSLHVFGISNFAPIYVHFLYLLSEQIPVHIYWMNPVEGYWGDGPTHRQWVLAKAFDDPEILMAHNPLLASFGRMGREFVHTVYGGDDGNHEVQEEDHAPSPGIENAKTRLLALQRSLRENQPNDTDFGSEDRSIEIHSCHTPLREVEVLKTYLLTLAEEQPFDPGDILVLCPDIQSYAPAIEAVFGARQQGDVPRLPYTISDQNSPLEEPAISALLKLFDLNTARFTNREALSLLSIQAIAANFELSENDLFTIKEWVTQNGIRWGFDGRHVREVAPSCPDTPWTWRDGLDRMLLGYAMPQPGKGVTLWRGIRPFHDIEGTNTRLLGALCAFVDWCAAIKRDLAKTHTLSGWVERTRYWIDQGYDKSSRNQEVLRPLRQALESINQQAEFIAEVIPAKVFAEHLESELGDVVNARGFLTGSITFCEMKPMRAIPARAICLLGMNHDNFPRSGGEVQFDLTLNQRLPGDRSTRDDDCYSFLEALLSARESLFISYIGKSIKDGKPHPPSTAIQTLIDHTPGLKARIVDEKLHAFDPLYFDAASPRSHARDLLEAARTLTAQGGKDKPHLHISLDGQQEEEKASISIDAFVRWFTKTADQFLRLGLQAKRRYLDEPMNENEPLAIDPLAAWRMKAATLDHHPDMEDQIQAWRQEGMVPAGELGERAVKSQLEGLDEFLADLPETKPLEISVTVDGLTIHGNIPVAQIDNQETVFVAESSSPSAPRQLTTWIYSLLASTQAGTSVPAQLCGTKKNGANKLVPSVFLFNPPGEQEALLIDLVRLYRAAQRSPLPHFPKTAEAYLGVNPKNNEDEEALEGRRRTSALKAWESSDYSTGESEDDAVQLLFDTSEPFSDEFFAITETIWEPLITHRLKR